MYKRAVKSFGVNNRNNYNFMYPPQNVAKEESFGNSGHLSERGCHYAARGVTNSARAVDSFLPDPGTVFFTNPCGRMQIKWPRCYRTFLFFLLFTLMAFQTFESFFKNWANARRILRLLRLTPCI